MATHSSVLAWRIPGIGEPGGLPSMGLHRVGHAQLVKNPPAMQEAWVQSLGWEDPLEKVSMVSVCLPSDALLQHLPSYLGFSYLGRGVSLHGYSSKVQPLLLTLDKGYPRAPLGPPASRS